MKKLLLSASALLLSFGFANAQGWETTGAHDDFATTTPYANGTNGEGLYWFDLTGGDTLALTRNTGSMTVAVATAGGCNATSSPTDFGKCYPIFGVNFGNDGGTPATAYVVDLSSGADITLDIENTHATQTVFMSIQLEDVNGVKSEIEPNISDVTSVAWAGAGPDRKALNGITIAPGVRKTVTIDLSSVSTAIGGLTVVNYSCAGPADCPTTTYSLNASQIKTVMFQVNFGLNDINISEGEGDHTVETFISGASIVPFTGNIIVHDFKVGSVTTGVNEAVINNSLNVYPNPVNENEGLTVSYEASAGTAVSMTDIVGNTVYSTSVGAGENKLNVPTAGLQSGMYILNIATENGVVARKVTIK